MPQLVWLEKSRPGSAFFPIFSLFTRNNPASFFQLWFTVLMLEQLWTVLIICREHCFVFCSFAFSLYIKIILTLKNVIKVGERCRVSFTSFPWCWHLVWPQCCDPKRMFTLTQLYLLYLEFAISPTNAVFWFSVQPGIPITFYCQTKLFSLTAMFL